jgi:EAL domain-containing protein (putative c-di-GMP-specific phosphodiesterase class I)/DNA-binding response OmpR family regulator
VLRARNREGEMDEELTAGASTTPLFRGPLGSGAILIVDDDESIRRLFTLKLERAGFQTIQASNGRVALDLLARHQVALVLLDSQMPVMSGLETLAEIRRSDANQTLPIIIVTGLTEVEDRVAGLAAGADDYVTKPVALDELVARVRSHLRAFAAWNDIFERGLAERRAVVQALREARAELTPEQTAAKLLEHLSASLGMASLACLRFTRERAAVPLAVSGPLRAILGPTFTIPAPRSAVLIERSRDGPWLQSWVSAIADDLDELDDPYPAMVRDAGVRGTAYVPLRHAGEVIGLIAASATDRDSDFTEDDLARRLPSLIGFAELAGALLGPQLVAYDRTAHARAAVESVIATRAFAPVFQPIVDLASGRIVAYEALTRFDDGLRPDLRFREADGLGLGDALEEVCLAAAIAAAGALPREMALSVNVSPSFLLGGSALERLVASAGRPIVAELTEHVRIRDYREIRAAIAALGHGARLAVDDTGAGVNSLLHLVELKPDFVKIDISLVSSLDTDPARRAIVRALTYFADEVGQQLVAEGIETPGELETLRSLGVHMGQGYLLGRPRPLASGS